MSMLSSLWHSLCKDERRRSECVDMSFIVFVLFCWTWEKHALNGFKLRCTKCKNDPFAVFKAPCGVMFSLKCCQSVEKLLKCSVLDWRALMLLKGGVMSAAEWVDGRTSWEDAEQASYPSLVSGSLSDLGFCIFDFPPSNCSFYLNREKAIARSMNGV